MTDERAAPDWKRVKALIARSEAHARGAGESLTHDEWKELSDASGHDRARYLRVLGEVTGKP